MNPAILKQSHLPPLQNVSSWGLRNLLGNVTISNLCATRVLGSGRNVVLLNKKMIRELSGGVALPS